MSKHVYTVFLSSTVKDLTAQRNAVIDELNSSSKFKPINQENFGAIPRPPVEACRQKVESCDIYVGLFSSYRGWLIPDDGRGRSITEFEYDTAVALKKPRFCWIDKNRIDADQQQGVLDQGQANFIQRILAQETAGLDLSNSERLASQLVKNLYEWLDSERPAGTLDAPPGFKLLEKLVDGLDTNTAVRSPEGAALRAAASAVASDAVALSLLTVNTLLKLGGFFADEEPELATTFLRQSTALEPGNWSAWVLLGRAKQNLGDVDAALEALNHGRELADHSGDAEAKFTALFFLGSLHIQRGNNRVALAFLEKSLAMAQTLGDVEREASALTSVADSLQAMGEPHKAERARAKAARLKKRLNT